MRNTVVIVTKSILVLLSLSAVALLTFAGWLVWYFEYGIGLPDGQTLTAVSATGHICSVGHQRAYVALAEIPPLIRRAVIAYEEPDFYERPSVNPFTELALAALFNRGPRPARISASVTRCLISLSPGCCKGIDWHIGNAVLMNRVERKLPRDLILEIYLNETYIGHGSFGVAAAATSYFGKSLGELGIDEIAFIVTLPRKPSPRKGSEIAQRDVAIDRMLQAGAISTAQAAIAKQLPLELKPAGDQQRL